MTPSFSSMSGAPRPFSRVLQGMNMYESVRKLQLSQWRMQEKDANGTKRRARRLNEYETRVRASEISKVQVRMTTHLIFSYEDL